MEGFWGIVVVVGPILLIAAIIYATLRNRKAKGATERRADLGAKRLREDIEHSPDRDPDL